MSAHRIQVSLSPSFGALLVLAAWLARLGQTALPLYLGLFGLLHLYYKVTNPGELLGAFTWNGPQAVDFWWVVLLSLVGLYLLVAKILNGDKAGQLFFLLFMTFLLRQTNFISNPLSPVFGFAGVGFIAFGVLWDALTSGSWANTSTPGLSRPSRIFLYLGYVILTVTVINWALTTHDLSSLNQLTDNTALVGLAVLAGRCCMPSLPSPSAGFCCKNPPRKLSHRRRLRLNQRVYHWNCRSIYGTFFIEMCLVRVTLEVLRVIVFAF